MHSDEDGAQNGFFAISQATMFEGVERGTTRPSDGLLSRLYAWLFSSGSTGTHGSLLARWIFLRLLALWCFSAFYSLVFQIRGLIGPSGILPAATYLHSVAQVFPSFKRLWYAPTLLWFSAGNAMLVTLCWVGMIAAVLLLVGVWPRFTLAVCGVCYLSFVAAAQDFSGYQSDGMLLDAVFISIFFAPRGLWPGLGIDRPPSRASLWLLRWEWFRIYFESGMAKLLSGDPEWRHLTAMDNYYQNSPLPSWVGWYVQQAPHWFAKATAVGTLGMELGVVLLVFLPRHYRLICFLIVTPWEVGVILTANYTFLNYLVLSLGVLLLDDGHWHWLAHRLRLPRRVLGRIVFIEEESRELNAQRGTRLAIARTLPAAAALVLVFFVTTSEMAAMVFPVPPPLMQPAAALEPFRIANQYGLFAVMTRGEYEIEFQGSADGVHWTAYPFRYKPQAVNQAPGIYAPYQPRFDWNLWFASLGNWQQNTFVVNTEIRLLQNDQAVLTLFGGDPFKGQAPRFVRAVLWQYWFTTEQQKHATGDWWRRIYLGVYAPVLERTGADTIISAADADSLPPHG
jgi:hypothetical protein